MKKIGGNITAVLQVRSAGDKNAIGERIHEWTDAAELTGYLDLASGDSPYSTYAAKIQESSHYFLCDYSSDLAVYIGSEESCRMMIKGSCYDVMLIDDVMELHEHMEIYLKMAGGTDG